MCFTIGMKIRTLVLAAIIATISGHAYASYDDYEMRAQRDQQNLDEMRQQEDMARQEREMQELHQEIEYQKSSTIDPYEYQ